MRVALPIAFVVGLVLANVVPAAASSSPQTDFDRLFAEAQTKIGDRWVHFAKGPTKFDCVGYVYYVFNQEGLKDKIGGYRGVKGYYDWFRARNSVSRDNPQPGDLIIWGNFQHVGMYIGSGQAISALVNPWGVKIHPVKGWLNERFRYYLHTHLATS